MSELAALMIGFCIVDYHCWSRRMESRPPEQRHKWRPWRMHQRRDIGDWNG